MFIDVMYITFSESTYLASKRKNRKSTYVTHTFIYVHKLTQPSFSTELALNVLGSALAGG